MPANKIFSNLGRAKQIAVRQAALAEFAEHGYNQASSNRIAAALGIAKGSLFKYFSDKAGIFEHVFDWAVDRFAGPLREARERTRDMDFFARTRASLEAALACIDREPMVFQLYCRILFERFPGRERFLGQVRGHSARYLRSLAEQGLARGELRQGLDVDAVVFVLDAVLDRVLQAHGLAFMDPSLGLARADARRLAARLDQIMDLLRQGLGPLDAKSQPDA